MSIDQILQAESIDPDLPKFEKSWLIWAYPFCCIPQNSNSRLLFWLL